MVRDKSTSFKKKSKTGFKISRQTVLDISNIMVLVISLVTNIYLTSVNNSISQQNLELQKTAYNYVPFVTGFQQEITTIKYETQRGTMKVKVIVISPHVGYYNITLTNYTLFEENLDMSHENRVDLEHEIRLHTTTAGAVSFDEGIDLWTMLFPSSKYLPPEVLGARIPVARLFLDLTYQDTQTGNLTNSEFPGSLWLSINMTDLQQ